MPDLLPALAFGRASALLDVLEEGVEARPDDDIAAAAAVALLLARSTVLRAAGIPVVAEQDVDAAPVLGVLRTIGHHASGKRPLSAVETLVDWWHLAYVGEPCTGAFAAQNGLPTALRPLLAGPADGPAHSMIAVQAERAFRARVEDLRAEIERRRRNYSDVAPRIYLDEADAFVAAVLDNGTPDVAWIDADPAALVHAVVGHSSRYYDGPIFAKLVNVEIPAVQTIARDVERLRGLRRAAELPARTTLPSRVSNTLQQVARAALVDRLQFSDEAVEAATERLVDELIDAVHTESGAVRLARLIAPLGLREAWVADALEPIHELESQLADLEVEAPSSSWIDLEPWIDELRLALEGDDPAEAREYLKLVRTEITYERTRETLAARAAEIERRLEAIDDASVQENVAALLRAVTTLIDTKQFFAAEETLRRAAEAAGLLSLSGAAAPARVEPSEPDPPAAHASEPTEDIGFSEREARRLYLRGDLEAARELLEEVVRENPWSPMTYLLLKIYSRGGSEGCVLAERFVADLRDRRADRNHHYIVLARMAMRAGDRRLAESAVVRASELGISFEETRRLRSAFQAAFEDSPDAVLPDAVEALTEAIAAEAADQRLEELVDRVVAARSAKAAADAAFALLQTRPDLAQAVLERALDEVPATGRPRILHTLVRVLRHRGDDAEADQLERRIQPPIPPEVIQAGPPALSAELLRPRRVILAATMTMPEPLRTWIAEAAETSDSARAAQLYVQAGGEGYFPAYTAAISVLADAGLHVECLELYRSTLGTVFPSISVIWSVACAYARIGMVAEAAQSLALVPTVIDEIPREQRLAATRFLEANGRDIPDGLAELDAFNVETAAELVTRSRRAYEEGDVRGATRLARELIDLQPTHPGVLVLFKIYRDQQKPQDAERLVEDLAQRGAAHWRHHVELARVALESGHYERAATALRDAKRLGAVSDFTRPLEVRLGAITGEAPYSAAALSHRENGVPAIVRIAEAAPLDPRAWDQFVRRQVDADRFDELLDATAAVIARHPWTILPVVEAAASGARLPEANRSLERLIALTASSGHRHAVMELSLLLTSVGRLDRAIALLEGAQTARDRFDPASRPRIAWELARLLRSAGRASDAAGVLSTSAPPLPAQPLPDRLQADSAWVPEPMYDEAALLDAVTVPALDASPRACADWLETSAAAMEPRFLGSLVGYLVATDRPELALQVYARRAGSQWIDARTSFNVGCAYATRGELEPAAESFLLHARYASQPLTEARRERRDLLLIKTNRATPETEPEPAASALLRAPGEITLDALEHDGTQPSFVRAIRRLIDAIDAGELQPADARERAEAWYVRFRPPGGEAVAALARLRLAIGAHQEAWSELWAWMQAHEIHNTVLQAAVALAPVCGAVADLREYLRDEPQGSAPVALAQAKLAEVDRDYADMRLNAQRAVQLSPTWVEARLVLDRSDPSRPVPVSQPAAESIVALIERARDAESLGHDAMAVIVAKSYELLDAFELDTNAFLRCDVERLPDPAASSLRPNTQRLFNEGCEAASHGEWAEAEQAFRGVFELHPRTTHAVWNFCVALMETGKFATARRIAGTMAYSLRGARLLAALDLRQEQPRSAAARLEASEDRLPGEHAVALARAGILCFHLDAPTEAAEALDVSSRRALPGVPHRHAILALLLALEADQPARARDMLGRLLSGPLRGSDVVDWVVRTERLEALRAPLALPIDLALDVSDVDRIADHFAGRRTSELLRVLRTRAFAGPTPDPAWCPALLRMVRDKRGPADELDLLGRLVREMPGVREQAMGELEALCKSSDSSRAWASLLALRREYGPPASDLESDAQRKAQELETARLAHWSRCLSEDAVPERFTSVEAIRSLVTKLGGDMARAAADTTDRRGVELLRSLWARQLPLIGQLGDPDATVEFLELDRETREVQRGFLFAPISTLAQAIGRLLYQPWETLARDALVGDPASLCVVRASRLEGGPLEVVVELQTAVELQAVTLGIRHADPSVHMISRMAQGERRHVGLQSSAVLAADDFPLWLDMTFRRNVVDEGHVSVALHEFQIDTDPPAVVSRFSPTKAALGDVFRGRTAERERLAQLYGAVGDGRIWFVEGPRQIGKSSLVASLARVDGPPDAWLIPRTVAVPVRCDEERRDTVNGMFGLIAECVYDRLEALIASGSLERTGTLTEPDETLRSRRFASWCRSACEAVGGVRLLIALDEVQVALRTMPRGERDAFMESIRAHNDQQRGTLAFLMSGSCTVGRLRDLVSGSNIAAEIDPMTIGVLDRDATAAAFRAGLVNAFVLPDAAERIWTLSGGHPNWVHLVGANVAMLLDSQRRQLVDDQLVEAAGAALTADQGLLERQVRLTAEGPDATSVLRDLADEFRDSPVPRPLEQVLDRFEDGFRAERRAQLEAFAHMGLLRFSEEGTSIGWTNELLWRALLLFADREARNDADAVHRAGRQLDVLNELGTLSPIPGSKAIRARGSGLIARPLPVAEEDSPEQMLSPADVFRLFEDFPAGFPDYRGSRRSGAIEWHLFKWMPGRSLANEVEARRAANAGESLDRDPMTPADVAATIQSAAERLAFAYEPLDADGSADEKRSLTHGNIKPSNVIVQADGTAVVVDWESATVDSIPTTVPGGTAGYMAPGFRAVRGASHADDVFSLGVTMYQALTGELPYGQLVRHGRRGGDPPRRAIETGLWEIVRTACAIKEADRYRTAREFADALDRWWGQRGGAGGTQPIHAGGITLNDNSVRIRDVFGTVGAIGHRSSVQNSFNTINESSASESIKAALRELLEQSMVVGKALDPGQNQQLLTDTNKFIDEATQTKPRAKILLAYGGALTELARQANDLAGPFIELVDKVVGLVS